MFAALLPWIRSLLDPPIAFSMTQFSAMPKIPSPAPNALFKSGSDCEPIFPKKEYLPGSRSIMAEVVWSAHENVSMPPASQIDA